MAVAWGLEVFLGSMLTAAVASPQWTRRTVGDRLVRGFACAFGAYPPSTCIRRHAGVSLLRRSVAVTASDGMLTVSSIGAGSRLCLRPRLTLIRLALIRKPWSCGEGVSRPLCRYLYLHLRFRSLQRASRHTFRGAGMLPYQWRHRHHSTASVPDLCPIIIHARPLDR